MWLCKFRLRDSSCPFSSRTQQFHLYCYQYPLRAYKKENKWFYVSSNILFGEEKNKQDFIDDIKKDKRIIDIKVDGNFLITTVSGRYEEWIKDFYNQSLIFAKPVINAPDGNECWEICSFDREVLTNIFSIAREKVGAVLLNMKEMKPVSLFVPKIMPELTDQQRKAFEIAMKQGYYSFPRKINLDELSRFMNLSRPTYQEHLRKAEIKLIEFMHEMIP